ncbi:unnamed protein product [Arabis nemorensis]|uniref:Uncharacterized protein n=1 Tax=Arabis nemorensis TaxID=586526 RepID=A0A565BL33_9BRAS|nr:unnamed protein product [Arabis nemorensis]
MVTLIMMGKLRMKASFWMNEKIDISELCQALEDTYRRATQRVYETIQEEPSQTNFNGMTKDQKLDMIIAILVKLEERLKAVEKVLEIEYRKTDEQRESDKPEQETQEKESQDKEVKKKLFYKIFLKKSL